MSTRPDSDESAIRVETRERGPVQREIRVEVPVARVRQAFERSYAQLARRVDLPGFRRGKAPRSVLERRFGASLAEDIERELVSETFEEALRRSGLEPMGEPAIDAEPPRPDAEFRYSVRVEIRPAIPLPDLAGLPARRRPARVGDEDVEAELERLRFARAPLVEEPEATAAAPGQVLTVDFVGRIDGEPFEGGSGRGVELELGSGRFVPGFEEGLAGARSGEDRELTVRFPEDYGNPALRGRQARFQVHVAAIRRRRLPDLDDEFAKDLGEFESLEGLRARIRSDLLARREEEARAELRRSLMDSLIERTPFDVPPGMVERERDRRLERARRQLGGAVPEGALDQQLARWREAWRPDAEREVREGLLLEAVATQEGLEASDTEVEARIAELAGEHGVSARQLREAFGERALEAGVRARLAEDKALEFLAAQAKFDETPGT